MELNLFGSSLHGYEPLVYGLLFAHLFAVVVWVYFLVCGSPKVTKVAQD